MSEEELEFLETPHYETPTLLFWDKNGKPLLHHEASDTCWCEPLLTYYENGEIDEIYHHTRQ